MTSFDIFMKNKKNICSQLRLDHFFNDLLRQSRKKPSRSAAQQPEDVWQHMDSPVQLLRDRIQPVRLSFRNEKSQTVTCKIPRDYGLFGGLFQSVTSKFREFRTSSFRRRQELLNSKKKTSNGLEVGKNITNTPTFIFLKNSNEENRIVEFPYENLEKDIFKIINKMGYKNVYYSE